MSKKERQSADINPDEEVDLSAREEGEEEVEEEAEEVAEGEELEDEAGALGDLLSDEEIGDELI